MYRLVLAITLCINSCSALPLNDRPIIGIIGQRIKDKLPIPGINATSFIPASYVKYIESAGGRAVPIPTNTTDDELTKLFSYINGVILPGGNIDILNSPYRKHAELLFKASINAYDTNGDHFPVWGTCMGLQTLAAIAAQSASVISRSVGTEDWPVPLNFTESVETSRMFSDIPIDYLKILESEDVTYNAHYNCVSADAYRETPELNDFFSVLSTNTDKDGKEFLSTIEAKHYPIYAVQWHPEMNPYEFTGNEGLSHINHSKDAIMISQYFADFLVNEARKSQHKFPDQQTEQRYLIYNYRPYFTGAVDLILTAYRTASLSSLSKATSTAGFAINLQYSTLILKATKKIISDL